MEQVNELIERLMQVGIHFTNPTKEEDMQTIQDAVKFLKSLQPSGNDDITDALFSIRQLYVSNHVGYCAAIDRAIAALSAPKPFDVLEHLRNSDKDFLADGERWKHEVDCLWYFSQSKWNISSQGDQASLLWAIINNECEPYTPPEPELEDGWYMCEVTLDNTPHERPLYKRGTRFFAFPTSKKEQFLKTKPLWRIEKPEV